MELPRVANVFERSGCGIELLGTTATIMRYDTMKRSAYLLTRGTTPTVRY